MKCPISEMESLFNEIRIFPHFLFFQASEHFNSKEIKKSIAKKTKALINNNKFA